MKKKNFLPMNLQFFAEGDSTDEGKANEGNGSEADVTDDVDEGGEETEKTFTQSQVSAMMTKEKKEGKMSILKSLGFSNEKEAKDAIALLNALQNSQKSDKEKLDDANEKSQIKLNEVEARAIAAESKLICLENGVDKDCLDDVMAIASSKVDDDNSLEDVIKAMKKDSKYASFFVSKDKGTGKVPGNNSGNDDKDSIGGYGKSLASKAAKMASSEQKSSYFN